MKCLCGSGKFSQNCHGKEISEEDLRKYIKYDVLKAPEPNQLFIYKNFKSMGFGKQRFKCKLQYLRTQTPAGEIIYPTLVSRNGKALRPVTIDGVHFDGNSSTTYQFVHCMITPLSQTTIGFDTSSIKLLKNGYIEAECYIDCEGNPFESLYALDLKDGLIKLYHHTSSANEGLIHSTSKMLGSKWNLQGTEELTYHHHIYFTSLNTIIDIFDLLEIGMADKGTTTKLCTDDGKTIETFEVYREELSNRDCRLAFWVDPTIISPPPLILHEPEAYTNSDYSWWEVFHNSIYRVPIKDNSFLPIKCIGDKEYMLSDSPNLCPVSGFNAGHGMDMESMKRVLSEEPGNKISRSGNIQNADIGLLDDLWLKTWSKNLSKFSYDLLSSQLKTP